MIITTQQKLVTVERLIEDFRWARPEEQELENETYNVLKALAKDLRGRLDRTPSTTEHEIERRIVTVQKYGSRTDHLNALAHEVMKRWPTVKQALERFGSETD